MRAFESVEGMDRELAARAKGAGKLRVTLGAGLEALARTGGHHALGFSSLEAYALERCERSARWVQQTRALVRRLSGLPAIRGALMAGSVSFSMAEVLAKAAQPESEVAWLAEARSRTVRQMRLLVAERRLRDACETGGEERSHHGPGHLDDELGWSALEGDRSCPLTVTLDQEDAWVLECARMIVKQAGGVTPADTVEALLGEGTTSLLEAMGPGADFDLPDEEPDAERQRQRQRAWEAQLALWREQAEALCEARFRESARAPGHDERGHDTSRLDPSFEGSPACVDAALRRVAAELAGGELEMGSIAESLWKADGWRRMGYATGAQYARERLGTSLSSVKAKRALARRTVELPELGEAIRRGEVGYEAARLIASIATRETAPAWTARARERTVKHLREEVDAAKLLARIGKVARCGEEAPARTSHGSPPAGSGALPPTEETTRELAQLESHIVSGAVFRDAVAGPLLPDRGASPECSTSAASQMSSAAHVPAPSASPDGRPPCLQQLSNAVAAFLETVERGDAPEATQQRRGGRARSAGRVTLRLTVTEGLRHHYRWLEELHRRYGQRRMPFLRFLCASLVETWKHTLGGEGAYQTVYARDRYRCTSPVCGRRDVTPHHLRFRSAGGGDEPENVTSLCVWCHLEGIHGGRMRAAPPASDVTWTLGQPAPAHTVVSGRRRRLRAVPPAMDA